MTTALVLAGHGSHITPETAGLVWSHVDRLRAMGVADEVTAAFWKEAPSFHSVLRTLTATDITIIPLFTAQGYFTQTVIPAEMNLGGPITERDGRIIRYTRTLGEHAYLFDMVRQRIGDAMQVLDVPSEQVAVAIIGHSTRRNPESRKATEAQTQYIRQLDIVAEVQAVYLDDTPEIAEIYHLTSAPYLIAIPYFLAAGSHTTIDVPTALGLGSGQTRAEIKGRQVFYTSPVGTEDSLGEVILQLASDAGASLYNRKAGSQWDCFPLAGREQFLDAVRQLGVMQLGQLKITMDRVGHWDDDTTPSLIFDDPAVLRRYIRENPFRPLATSDDLPRGWRVIAKNSAMLHAVVETVYPGAIADWANYQNNRLSIQNLVEITQRQTGNYRQLAGMSLTKQEKIVDEVCGSCVLQPQWFTKKNDAIPCPEPCNFWMSRALEFKETLD